MKKIFTLIVSTFITSAGLFAQATPNAGFEAWTHNSFPSYDTPNSWDNLNPSTGTLGVYTCIKATAAADIHSGAAAIKLITKSVFGQTANGIATTGTINTTSQTIGGGIAYTLRPDSIVGFYKYTPVTGDNGFAEIQLLGAGGDTDTIGYARFTTPTTTVGSYTRFAKAIVYRNANPIAKSIFILSSSKDAVTHFVGSTAFFDDVNLVFAPATGIVTQPKFDLTVGPNPSIDRIIIKNNLTPKAIFVLYDVTGRKVAEKQIEAGTTLIDVNDFPMGLYIYSVSDENNNVIKTDKLIIQK
ncbi:MAG: T9SS type A sorting domain-containing protein [Bacteroidetes bacterium]|nr:T9SS type A sorting domain-containing protein [Bacteroidota bacterium]